MEQPLCSELCIVCKLLSLLCYLYNIMLCVYAGGDLRSRLTDHSTDHQNCHQPVIKSM